MSREAQKPSGERRVLARGAVGVDPRAAIAKLREFMLPDPALYVAELVRVAVELGAQKITVDNTARDFSLECVCKAEPPKPELIVRLFEQLFSSDARAVRLLAIATNTALGLGPKFVDVYTGAERKDGAVARVRFVPTAEGEEPAIDGALEWVPAPEGFTDTSLRVHVRERFGTNVVREWFGEPVESKVLRTRCLLVPASIVRAVDGAELDRGAPPPALVRVPLAEKVRGELALVRAIEREMDVVDFYERGVLLSREALFGGDPPQNLRAYVDEPSLPTNVSRSAIDRSGSYGRQLSRALEDAKSRLITAAVEALQSAHGAETAAALRALILRKLGSDWVVVAAKPEASRDDLFLQPALRAPLIPMVNAKPRSLADLASVERGGVMLFRGEKLPSAALAPWLTNVVHATDETISALIEPLEPKDADVALAHAEESHARYQRFLAHQPREARVSGNGSSELVRALIGEARRDGATAGPAIVINGDRSIEGELVIHRSTGADRAMELVVFVEGRPLPASAEAAGPLLIQAAIQHKSITARADFSGPERSAALNALVEKLTAAAADALWFTATFVADPKACAGDERVHWMGPAAHKFNERERAVIVELALRMHSENRSTKAARARLSELLTAAPAVERVPLFTGVNGRRWSIAELRAVSEQCGGAVLYTSNKECPEHPRAPVLLLSEPQRQLVGALLGDSELVDYGRFAKGDGDAMRAQLAKDASSGASGPWLSLIEADAVAKVCVAPRNAHFALLHAGQVVSQASDTGPFGRCLLRVHDKALIPRPGKDFSRAQLSADARKLYDEAPFDLLFCMLRAIGGDREAARMLDVSLPWSPPQHVLSFIFVATARLRALPPEQERGTLSKTTHFALLRRCEELPLVTVRTKNGPQTLSLSALRERAKSKPAGLFTVEHAPDDIDYDDDFEPLVVSRGEFEAALAVGIGAKLIAADSVVPQRREVRKTRLALEAFERQSTVNFADLSEFRVSSTVTVQQEHYECAMGLLPTPGRARYQVIVRDRVAVAGEVTGTDLMSCPVVFRVRFAAPEKALNATLDGLTSAGLATLTIASKRALRKLVEEVCKDASGASDPGASVRALVAAFCGDAGRVDDKLRARVGRAVLWKAIPSGLASAEQCAVHGKGRVLYVSREFDGWIPAPDGETDPIAAYLEPLPDGPTDKREAAQEFRRAVLRTLEFTTTLAPRDATEDFDRLQRTRRLLRSAKENIALAGSAPSAALRCRIEDVEPKLGVGELRVTTSGANKLLVHLFLHAQAVRLIEAPSPIAISVAIETSALSEEQARKGEFPDALAQRIVGIARKLLTEAMRKGDELPAWSLPAQRWALLQGPSNIKSLRERKAFFDSLGAAMTLADIDEQQAKFGNVAYTKNTSGVPLEPLDSGRRVLRLSEAEAPWITGARVPLDYTDALHEEQQAIARRKLAPAKTIVVRQSVPANTPAYPLTIKEHDFEGEVLLMPSRAAPVAKVFLWQGRKPLGETETGSPWPALVAIEVGELKPNRSETAPVEDSAFHRTRARVAELVRAAIDAHFVAPPSALAMVRTNSAGSPSIRGGATRAIGVLWLLADPLEPGRIDVREPGESTLRMHDTRGAVQTSRVDSLPIGGQLWFNHGTAADVTIAHQVVELARWSYRAMLGQLIASKTASSELVYAHLAYAAAARALDTNALKKWAADRLLPDSCTTFARLEAHLAEGNILELCPEGDARSAQERFVVQRSTQRWFQVLEELALVHAASPARVEPAEPAAAAPVAPQPAPAVPAQTAATPQRKQPADEPRKDKPKAAPRELTLADHVLELLRSHGVVERDLSAVRVSDERAPGVLASYESSTATATVYTRHSVGASLLTSPDARRAHRVYAVAVLGEMNRAVQRFTDADEMRVLQALVESVAG